MPAHARGECSGRNADGLPLRHGPGYAKPSRPEKSYRRDEVGMKALYIAGNVPDTDFKADVLIVQASHTNALTQKADLVLPMTALFEKHGTIVNTMALRRSLPRRSRLLLKVRTE